MLRSKSALLSILGGGIMLSLAFLSGCAPAATPAPSATPSRTPTTLPTNTSVPPTATALPTPEPTATEVLAADYYCITCHTSKDNLIASAKPEVVVEKESEGVG